MTDHEMNWDNRLQITTAGLDDSSADPYRFRYEPTPYCILERLLDSGLIRKDDTVLDYGCGKGRVDFFLSAQAQANTIGIEYDDRIYRDATENQKTAIAGASTTFILMRAEAYTIPPAVNRCYFFNPFSVEILHKVLARIMESYYENPREVFLFFYYPSEEYISYLMTVSELEFYGEIPCGDLFKEPDKRERIIIFSLPGYESFEETES